MLVVFVLVIPFSSVVQAGFVQSSDDSHIQIFMWVANQSASNEALEKARSHCAQHNKTAKFKSLEQNVYKYECVEVSAKSDDRRRLELIREYVREINKVADENCKDVTDGYQTKIIGVSGKAAAKMAGLAKTIADIEGDLKGGYYDEQNTGIPQHERRIAFKDSNECR